MRGKWGGGEGLRYQSRGSCAEDRRSGFCRSLRSHLHPGLCSLTGEQAKENLRKLEEENENLALKLKQCSTQLDAALCRESTTQKINQELNSKVSSQKPLGGEEFEPCDP